jgi:lipopolysaccharide transport system ATP-binding protein
MSRAEVARKLDAIVDFAGLHDFIDTPVKRYSSGMNARLGFAIAAHVDPDVLLIDEVLAVGDLAFQQKCFERLADFRKSGAAIVLVSHSMQAIVSLCDRAILLRPGRDSIIGPVGDVAALYSSPQAQAVDPRIEIESMRLVERGGYAPLKSAVRPGTHLTLDTRIRINAPLPNCCVEFSIVRDDGLVMYNGSPMADGDKPIDLDAGAVLSFTTHFTANVLRGTYRIVVHLVDGKVDKLWLPISVSGPGSFVVHETRRVHGCADVAPSYEFHVGDAADEPARVLRAV